MQVHDELVPQGTGTLAQEADVQPAGQERQAPDGEQLEGARILRPAAGGIVAARDENDGPVPRRGEHLVAVDAAIELARLAYFVAEGAIVVYAMDRHVAGIVVGGEQIFA